MGEGAALKASVISRLREGFKPSLFRNSFFLLLRTFLTYAMGFVFWLVVARSYSAETMGYAAAILSTLLLLARAAALGLPTGLLRFLPGESDKVGLINGALTVSAISALAVGLVFLAGLGLWAPLLTFVRSDLFLVATLIVSLLFFTLDGVVDNAFVAARRADYGLIRISIFYGLRIPLVWIVAFAGLFGVLVSWTFSLVVSVVAAALLLPRFFKGYRPFLTIRRMRKREIMGFSLWSYAGGLVGGAASFLLPLVILNTLGSTEGPAASGHFYAAYTIATFLYAVPHAFSTSLLVEGSHPGTDLGVDTRRTVRYSGPLLALGIAGTLLLGQPILGLFGEAYSQESYATLVLLALASPILLASSILATELRVAKRVRPLFMMTAIAMAVTLVSAYALLPVVGILGAAIGTITGQSATLLLLLAERVNRRRVGKAIGQPA